jgi:hypothetical protein
MKLLPIRLNEDGRTVSPVPRPRPISCPPPSTSDQLLDAGQSLWEDAYLHTKGVATREGTVRHQAAIALEHARMLHYVRESDWQATVHYWTITELGRFEWERKKEGT